MKNKKRNSKWVWSAICQVGVNIVNPIYSLLTKIYKNKSYFVISIFFAILIVFASLMHKSELIDNFIFALENPAKFIHPIAYSVIVYIAIFIIRAIFKKFRSLIAKREDLKNQ